MSKPNDSDPDDTPQGSVPEAEWYPVYERWVEFNQIPHCLALATDLIHGSDGTYSDWREASRQPWFRDHLRVLKITADAVEAAWRNGSIDGTAEGAPMTPAVRQEVDRLLNRDQAQRIMAAQRAPSIGQLDGLYVGRDDLAKLDRGEPLIDGVLDRHALAVIAGRDSTYKSFMVLAWLGCLATGIPWCGHEVERSRCLYVVGEGAWGLEDRVAAFEKHHGVTVDHEDLTVRKAPVNLFRGGPALEHLIERIELETIDVVAFDTLRRCSVGANLNLEADAGVVISNLDRVRQATEFGSVVLVAHTDKADNDTRGSGALEDDADIVWRTKLDDDGSVRAMLAKRKDGPDGLVRTLWPRRVGDSLVLSDERPEGLAESDPMPKWAHEILHELRQPALIDGASATRLAQTLGTNSGGLTRAFNWLLKNGHVIRYGSGRGQGANVRYVAADRPPNW